MGESAVWFKVQKHGRFRLRRISPNCTKTEQEVLWFCEEELAEFHLRILRNGVIINIGSVWVVCDEAHLIRLRNNLLGGI